MGELTIVERAAEEAARARDSVVGARERGKYGVVHTPARVCRYMALALDRVLEETGFGGLHQVEIVDPACGPGGFLAAALAVLGPRARGVVLRGFDRDESALEHADQVLRAQADRAGASLVLEKRDTLDLKLAPAGPLAILGNPPWSGRSASRAGDDALDAFRRDDAGEPLDERRIGVLSDAYVRFFAWSVREVARAGGALALVTNASFLDGPVHRGMRGAIRRAFPRVDLVDLGGSALVAKSRQANDANVFGVRPAAVVTVAATRGAPRIRYARLRGSAPEKMAALDQAMEFAEVASAAPEHRFVPRDGAPFPDDWVGLDALFPFHREGIQTNRDAVVVDADRDRLLGRMQAFALGLVRPDLEPAERPSRHYDPERARGVVREALERDPDGGEWIRRVAYRPFDERFYVALAPLCHRPRPSLARAMDHSSMALVTVRKDRGERPWTHLAICRSIPDNCLLSVRSSCRARAFPTRDPSGAPNLSARGRATGVPVERWIAYAAAFLASDTYRERWDGALKSDYPRVPWRGTAFDAIADAGEAVVRGFGEEARDAHVCVGHHEVDGPAALARARDAADALYRSVIDSSVD